MSSSTELVKNGARNDEGIMFLNPDTQNDSGDEDNEDASNTNGKNQGTVDAEVIVKMPSGNKNLQDSSTMSTELRDASYLSSTRSSTVKVEIADIGGEDSINMTTTVLRKCKSQIMTPYTRLLIFIGWRAFARDSVNSHKCGWKILNFLYPLLIVLLLFYTYFYEVVACQWKLNIMTDTQPYSADLTTMSPRTQVANATNASASSSTEFYMSSTIPSKVNMTDIRPAPVACEHVVTTYIIPNILHFAAFVVGYFYFRIHDNEQLYALMEKVFLQVTALQGKAKSQSRLITKLRLFIALGVIWVFLTLAVQVMFVLVFGIDRRNTLAELDTGLRWLWVLFGIQLVGIAIVNMVNVAVVINYCAQCELIIYYVRGIHMQLQEKSTGLRTAMKDMLTVRQFIGLLNGPMAQMTSIALIRFAELMIIGLSILFLNKDNAAKVWAYRAVFPCLWAMMLLFALIQAAKMNAVCAKFKQIALETRIFGYKNSSQLDLDSFLLFVANTRLRGKLFHIPVRPSYLIGIMVILGFLLLLLFQAGVFGRTGII